MAKVKAKKKATPKKKKVAPKKTAKTAASKEPPKKLIQVDMGKLRKKGWKYIDGFGDRLTGQRIVSEKRLAEWNKTGNPNLEGFEEELKKAMKG